MVQIKNILLSAMAVILCAGCSAGAMTNLTPPPNFVTAALPSTLVLKTTQASPLPAANPSAAVEAATPSPVEGITTTPLNVRADPSTAGAALGMMAQFAKVQIIGRDAGSNWYQIFYAQANTGKGWLRAEYVQVNNASAEIPLVETISRSGVVFSGVILQKVNVRQNPGTAYQTLGVLNSNDVVFIIGRDVSGDWLQVEFGAAPDGKGWVAAEFLQTGILDSVPVIGEAAAISPTPGTPMRSVMQDGDSMLSPLSAVTFSPLGARSFQISGQVSAPEDAEDWIRFTTCGGSIVLQLACSSTTLRVELWSGEPPVSYFSSACGDASVVSVNPDDYYFLRLAQNQPEDTNYILSVELIH